MTRPTIGAPDPGALQRLVDRGWWIARLVNEINFSHRGELEHFHIPIRQGP